MGRLFRQLGPLRRGFLTGVVVALLAGGLLWQFVRRATGQPYHDLSLVDSQGHPVDLARFDGQPLVINYWATWCAPCLAEFPTFERARQRYGPRVAFVMISDDPLPKARRLLQAQRYGMHFYFSRARLRLAVRPVTYFYRVDRQDVVLKVGQLDSVSLAQQLRRLTD